MLGIGTISHGTLRPYDLASALLPYAERYLDQWPYKADLEALRAIVDGGEDEPYEEDPEVVQDVIECLNNFVPDYCYLGMHHGDGSDLGVWPDVEKIKEELPVVSDASELEEVSEGDLVAIVNCHGNLTLAQVSIETKEIWSVV